MIVFFDKSDGGAVRAIFTGGVIHSTAWDAFTRCKASGRMTPGVELTHHKIETATRQIDGPPDPKTGKRAPVDVETFALVEMTDAEKTAHPLPARTEE